jgi:predicted nuclease of predicted toxin-antitoxin system
VSDRIRFHLDENMDSDVAKALRRQGIDVTTTAEMGLLGQPDEAQLTFVCQHRRVLVTHDADFLRFASQRLNHCGIAFCKKDVRTLGEIIRSLMLIYEVFTPEEMHGQVEYF